MKPVSTGDNQAAQLLNTLKQMRVPSRKLTECSEELGQTLGVIALLSDMNPESKEFFITNALEMAAASSEEDRNRAFLLLCVWSQEHDDRVDRTIDYLNKRSVVDDHTRDIERELSPDPPAGGVPAAWYADPLGRHEYRYWDGAAWTHHVADSGQTSVDPVDASPAVDEEAYVRSCSEAAFSDEKEERTFRSDPAFQLVLDSFNSQRYPAAIKAAEDLLPRFADFDWPYNLLGSAYRATDQLQQSREVLGRGLRNAKRKAFLLTEMGETLWRIGDVHQAVYYWCQALHCLSSNPVDYNAYLLLSYVAKGCGLGDIEQRLLGRVDAMQGAQPRLDPATAGRLTELVRTRKDDAIDRALQDIDAKYWR